MEIVDIKNVIFLKNCKYRKNIFKLFLIVAKFQRKIVKFIFKTAPFYL